MRPAAILAALAAGLVGRSSPVVYALSPLSRLEVVTGRSGLFSFVGHDHVVRAHGVTGRLVLDAEDLERSSIEIDVPAESLEVLTPADTGERRKVTDAMRTDVLDVAHYPAIHFVSRAVRAVPGGARVTGDLTLVGATRSVSVDMHLHSVSDTLHATGSFSLKQSDFGVRPYHGGPGGLVHVADRVTFQLDVVAVRLEGP